MPMRVKLEIIEMSEPELMMTLLQAKGLGGTVWLDQEATFTLTSIENNKTDVNGKLVTKGMPPLLRIFLLWEVKSFAKDSFDNVETMLKKWSTVYNGENS